jgi:hypothetical protein
MAFVVTASASGSFDVISIVDVTLGVVSRVMISISEMIGPEFLSTFLMSMFPTALPTAFAVL